MRFKNKQKQRQWLISVLIMKASYNINLANTKYYTKCYGNLVHKRKLILRAAQLLNRANKLNESNLKYGKVCYCFRLIIENRILCANALIWPPIIKCLLNELDESELFHLELSVELNTVYSGNNITSASGSLLGIDSERNTFHLSNGESLSN